MYVMKLIQLMIFRRMIFFLEPDWDEPLFMLNAEFLMFNQVVHTMDTAQ
jgi:hypothetical protein